MNEKMLREVYHYSPANKEYRVHIDLDTYRDVYSEWDFSPLINRDLDEDLIEYIYTCSKEIGLKRSMALVFHMPESLKDYVKELRSIEGYHRYFNYKLRMLKYKTWENRRQGLLLVVLGVVLLILSSFSHLLSLEPLVEEVLSEGLMIGAWVAMWETFTILFFGTAEDRHMIRHYKRLNEIPIFYEYTRQ